MRTGTTMSACWMVHSEPRRPIKGGPEQFRTRWAANNVRAHRAGVKIFNHPLIGRVALPAETMTITAAADHTVTVFAPQPGSPEHDALRLLASWSADHPTETTGATLDPR
jgi:hypothetical protein